MLQQWDDGLIGNSPGTVSGLAKRESLAQVLVRTFEPIHARRRRHEELVRAA